jgi:CheY-like chemotaxis protein
MDAATLERIFDAFYTTKPVGEGTGLGLSMVHGILRGHGGAVTVTSAPGRGLTFELYFPETRQKADPRGEPGRAVPRTSGRRVLYVDDEEALVLLATRVLARAGHSVTGFSDPARALAAFREQPDAIDILVTDLSMPLMSGVELARAVLDVRPHLPVLLTTGHIGTQDVPVSRDSGYAPWCRSRSRRPAGTRHDRVFADASDAGSRERHGAATAPSVVHSLLSAER